MLTDKQLVQNTACIYGNSGVGKTVQAGPLAYYIAEKYGLRTRLISADGGGWGPVQDYVNAGFIDALSIADEENPRVRLRQLIQGDWPDEHGKYIPREKDPRFAGVGMYFIEGWESICQILIAQLVREHRKIAENVVSAFTDYAPKEDGGESFQFGNAAQAHYGWVQGELINLIRGFQSLQNKGVKQIIFTTLCAQGEDDFTSSKILGPSSIGKALTASLPQRVGDLIYLTNASVAGAKAGDTPTTEFRAYISNKVDPIMKKAWPAKMRFPLQVVSKLKGKGSGIDVRWEGNEGYLVLDEEAGKLSIQGLSRLFRWRDEQSSELTDALKAKATEMFNRPKVVVEITETMKAEGK